METEKRWKQGIGEDTSFSAYHPAVNFIFFALTIGITMCSMDPVFLGITLTVSWAWSILLSGKKALKFNLLVTVPLVIVMAVVNGLFTHNGATVLFYLNDSRITMEAFVYGAVSALMISSVIVWFSCFNVVMTSDKFIYLFGKAAPVLGLTLSMIFRFIPLLKSRFAEISMGQRCMGRHEEKKFFAKVRQVVKEVSILISWSLEASIETADSMEARGYGLHGRTSFHLFRFTRRDGILLLWILAIGLVGVIGAIMGATSIYYYPKIRLQQWDLMRIGVLACYILLLITPMILDVLGEKKWQRYKLEI
ncbi:MAG: energy-coupling factor transporter transmembrane protein EcfT [Firmicutes bacterium]|nr:energy-coupling factor transporter transmembrane protein EcfT [Bacillota bacterium]